MKYLIIIIFLLFTKNSFADTETNCDGILAKLKSECNIVGKSMKKMKDFSKENQTLDQVGDNIHKGIDKGVDKIKKKF